MEAPVAEYPFVQVDAFTNRRLAGNPCAIIFDADDLDDTEGSGLRTPGPQSSFLKPVARSP